MFRLLQGQQCSIDIVISRMLIKKVNSTFESLDKARGLMTDWNERLSKTVRDILLNEETQEFLRDLFTSSNGSIMRVLGKFLELTSDQADILVKQQCSLSQQLQPLVY